MPSTGAFCGRCWPTRRMRCDPLAAAVALPPWASLRRVKRAQEQGVIKGYVALVALVAL